jgi:hypothetical protein
MRQQRGRQAGADRLEARFRIAHELLQLNQRRALLQRLLHAQRVRRDWRAPRRVDGWASRRLGIHERECSDADLITHGSLARTRVLSFNGLQLGAALLGLCVVLPRVPEGPARGRPIVNHLVGFEVRDEYAQRDRFMRETLDAMAQLLWRATPIDLGSSELRRTSWGELMTEQEPFA